MAVAIRIVATTGGPDSLTMGGLARRGGSMKDFVSRLHDGTRLLGLAAVLFLAAGESIPAAEAGTDRADLTPG